MMQEPISAIPASWAWSTIGEVVQERVEQSGPRTPDSFVYVDISSIDTSTKMIIEPKIILRSEAPSRARQNIQPHDVLVSMTRPNLNAVTIVPESFNGAIGSTGFDVLRTLEIEPRWLFYLVQTSAFVESMSMLVQGALYPAIRPRDVRGYRIPIAPIKEQRRIVAEIEKELTRLDAAVAALKRVQASLRRYRSSVLKEACEGRLVPTEAELCRREGRSYESASVLLARIIAERRTRWEADRTAKLKLGGKAPRDEKWKRNFKAAASPDTKSLGPLPEGWTWATVDQVAALEPYSITDGPFGSNLKTEHYTATGPRVIRLQNIGDGVFVDAKAHISKGHFEILMKHQIQAGDIVIAALAERPPRACVIPEHVGPAIVKADCVRFKPSPTVASARYLVLALNAEPTRKRTAEIVHGVGRPRLNLGEIKSIVLPLPPLGEQLRAASRAEEVLSSADEVERQIGLGLLRAERLRQSVLQRAFKGSLVPQDPNDEAADKLLDKIRVKRQSPTQSTTLAEIHPAPAPALEEDMPSSKQSSKRDLMETLRASDRGLPPEDLFSKAGYDRETIDDFYAALKEEILGGRIREIRLNENTVRIQVVSR